MQHFVTHRGGGQPYCLTKSYPHFQNKPSLLKTIFSLALAFVLSLFCFPNISNLFASSSTLSTITAAGWPTTISWDDKIKWEEETLNGHVYYSTTLGEWPQTFVGTSMEETLNSAVSSGSAKTTGKVYNINGLTWTEYSYDGKKYVQGNQKIDKTSYTFKDGTSVGKSGQARWFVVEPIKWWIIDGKNPFDEQEVIVISDIVLTANICFNANLSDGNNWENSFIRTFSNGEFYEKSNLKSAGSIVKPKTIENNVTEETADTGSSTTDYVWLLTSGQMAIFSPTASDDKEGKYYLSTHRGPYNRNSRYASPSDFALSNNSYMNMSSAFPTDYRVYACWYWTSSATNNSEKGIRICPATYDSSISVDNLTTGFRPSMTLIRTKSSQASFDDGISSYPGIYKASDGSYHISDYTGIKAMADFSNAGGEFKSTDKFLLDNDIDMTGQNFAISSMTGTFDGQGHSIYDSTSLFSKATNFTLQNLHLNFNGHGGVLIRQVIGDVKISNVIAEGKFVDPFVGAFTMFTLVQGDIEVSNLQIYATNNITMLFARDFTNSTATFNDLIVVAPQIKTGIANLNNANLTFNGCLINGTNACRLIASAPKNSSATFVNTYINITGNLVATYLGSLTTFSATDCAFVSNGTISWPTSGSLTTTGVYISDSTGLRIISPTFTNSRWCQTDRLNGGLPQLRQFLTVGNKLPTFDMQAWAKKMAS